MQEGRKTFLGSLGSLFGGGGDEGGNPADAAKGADIFLALNASTVRAIYFAWG